MVTDCGADPAFCPWYQPRRPARGTARSANRLRRAPPQRLSAVCCFMASVLKFVFSSHLWSHLLSCFLFICSLFSRVLSSTLPPPPLVDVDLPGAEGRPAPSRCVPPRTSFDFQACRRALSCSQENNLCFVSCFLFLGAGFPCALVPAPS